VIEKVATSVVSALKREPLTLALVVMNVCLMLLFYLLLTQREHEVELIYADKKEVREMLARCVVPEPAP
jgi:hypothetical protein